MSEKISSLSEKKRSSQLSKKRVWRAGKVRGAGAMLKLHGIDHSSIYYYVIIKGKLALKRGIIMKGGN